MTDSGKPRDSGIEDTLPAESIDETIPAPSGSLSDEPLTRTSRASIPPAPTERYRIGQEIGRGGMGRVVEAFDTQLGRVVALKEVLPTGQNVVRRFVREIEITARLEHASIVPLYDSGTTPDGRPFYVMKRLVGRPLDEEIRRAATLDERLTLLPAMLAAIDAIAHAHRRGVIHRDLKPANILVGELGQTTVIDWGLAKVIGETDAPASNEPRIPTAADSLQTQIGSVFGTPGFMSPEQARGEELTPTVDVYALGATFYQLLAGKPPMGGSSATEVIGKTLVHDVKPLASVVEGVPKDLVAIVDKALSFDAAVRYRDAGELAADVRRFQAGQLVAAHQYTRRQKLAKFAQRNRTVLGVLSIAFIAVAALGTYSIRRIITERDAADRAREQALVDKGAAEEARDRLAERNDALTVTRARALLASNPTQALVTVAEIGASSPRYGEAKAIAQAAAVRGVWWGMAGPDESTFRAELSADGSFLAQLTRDWTLRVWDLERRRIVLARPYGRAVSMKWAGDRVLVFGSGLTELLEPAANRSTPVPGDSVTYVDIPRAGDVALAILEDGGAALIDLGTFKRTPLWAGRKVFQIHIAEEGTWMLLRDRTTVVALDRAGTELTQHPDDSDAISVISRTRRAALVSGTAITELVLDPQPTWRTVPVKTDTPAVIPFGYHGDKLDVMMNYREIHTLAVSGLVARGITLDSPQFPTAHAATETLVIPTAKGLHLHNAAGDTVLAVPAALGDTRYIARAGVSRVVALGRGAIMITDLSHVLPRSLYLEGMMNFSAFDENTVLGLHTDDGLSWLDLTTKKRTKIEVPSFAERVALDEKSGRAAYVVRGEGANGIIVLRRNQPGVIPLVRGKDPWVVLLPGDAIAYGTSDPGSSVMVRLADGTDKKLGELGVETRVPGIIGRDVILVGADGRIMRFNIDRGVVDQTKIQLGESVMVATDNQSQIAIAVDNRVLHWAGGRVTEVARVPKRILYLYVRSNGTAIAMTEDNAVFAIPLVASSTPQLLASSTTMPTIDAAATRIAAVGSQNETLIIDLASKATWSLPPIGNRRRMYEHRLVADGTLYVETFGLDITFRRLPTVDGDLASWAREQTSAKLVDDTLVWPWQ